MLIPAILIVEEDDEVRRQVMDAVSASGYTVKVARDAAEALRVLCGVGGISVVLTDMHSQTRNGLELARYIKAQWPDVALILMSGWLLPFPGVLPEGAVFLSKPFGSNRLAAILAEAA